MDRWLLSLNLLNQAEFLGNSLLLFETKRAKKSMRMLIVGRLWASGRVEGELSWSWEMEQVCDSADNNIFKPLHKYNKPYDI